jgi:hypothetical protein
MSVRNQKRVRGRKLLSLRTTIVLLVAATAAGGAAVLSMLSSGNAAEAGLLAGSTFGCTMVLAHNLID